MGEQYTIEQKRVPYNFKSGRAQVKLALSMDINTIVLV